MRIFLCLLLLAATAQAGSNATTPNIMAPANKLPPETLTAIQRISRNVLQAKRMGRQQTDNNTEQLSQLNGALNKLIAVELQSFQVNLINLPGKSATTPKTQPATGLIARMAAQNQTWDVIDMLRQQASQLQGQENTPAQVQIYSGGFSIGQQRGRLFDKWADKLETILNSHSADSLLQLSAFKTQLTPQATGISNTANMPKTPSLQSMTRHLSVTPINNP